MVDSVSVSGNAAGCEAKAEGTACSSVPSVLRWVAGQAGTDPDELHRKFPSWDEWLSGEREPTLSQLEALATMAGVPFGYLLLDEPPALTLPISDFRDGFAGAVRKPSANLLAVLHLSIRRQDWYRGYAQDNSLPAVGLAQAGKDLDPLEAASRLRQALDFDVSARSGSWDDVRKYLIRAFERSGGLTIVTSMVGNNTRQLLNPDEFRGFTLADKYAPLVFVNARQTLNGQIFTLAHEFAHVAHGTSGISLEDPADEAQSDVEHWCNAVASEFLVPISDLATRYQTVAHMRLSEALDQLARAYRCGTLVILQAIRRHRLTEFEDFDAVYQQELRRLREHSQGAGESKGNFYNNQPFRIGERFSRAIINDALGGHTTLGQAIRLMSLKSLSVFDKYAKTLGMA